jgi:putative glutathione S-transferase
VNAAREVYDKAVPGWTGRCTAPLLVDRIEKRIVSNESADIVAVLDGLHLPGCSDVMLRPSDEAEAKAMLSLCEQVL